MSAGSVVVYANCATAPQKCSNEQKTARVYAQVERFVSIAVAAATYKQNDEYQPRAVATTTL